jgi:hypothetical protein
MERNFEPAPGMAPILEAMSMTLDLPDDVARRVAAEAARRGLTPEQVAAEAIVARFPPEAPQRSPKRRLAFGAIGRSGSGRWAADTDEMLAEGFGRD